MDVLMGGTKEAGHFAGHLLGFRFTHLMKAESRHEARRMQANQLNPAALRADT